MYGNKKETDKKGAGKKGMPRVRERIWDEYENGWHCTVPSLWMGGEDLIMKTVRIHDNPETSNATHWETCRYDSCIEHQCPLYDRCCGEVANA